MKNWRRVYLGEVIDLFDHVRVPLSATERATRKGPYPYYGAQGVIDYIDGYLFHGRYLLVPEDGENLNSRKLPIAYFADGKFWVNNHAHIIRGKAGVADDVFLKHCLSNSDIRPYVTGAAQPKLSQANLKRMEVLLPPFEVQRRIASILGAYDDLIEVNRRRNAVLEEMARRLFEEWFIRYRFPGHEQHRIVETPDGLLPEGWGISRVRQLVDRQRNGRIYRKDECELSGEVVVVDQSTDEMLGYHSSDPDHRATPLDPIAIFGDHTCKLQLMVSPFSMGPNTIAFKAKAPVSVYYLFDLIRGLARTQEYKRHWNELMDKSVVVAPISLAASYAERVAPFVEFQKALKVQCQNLRRQRDLLLPRLITGKVSVAAAERELEVTA